VTEEKAQNNSKQQDPSVRERILAILDDLPPKQYQLARYLLDYEQEIAFISANDVGRENGTSAATVVRFAQSLGYEGYTELQDQIRATITQHQNRTASLKLAERISQGEFSKDLPAHIGEVSVRNIEETFNQISLEVLDEAVDAILAAEHIHLFGGGLSAAAVILAQHSLVMLGCPAQAVINGGLSQTLQLASLTERDVVVVISIWRYLRESVEAAERAKSAGATLITLTDSLASPLARIADFAFIAATERAAHSRSLSGMFALVDLLGAMIVSKKPQQSMSALKHIDNLYHQYGKLSLDE
jgi:DNA-binding MurR/RpiR family transcriptional regulator